MQSLLTRSVTAPRHRRVWVVLLLSIAVIAIMSAFLSQSLKTLDEGAAWVAHSERVRFELARILQTLSDMGGGVAGYQLTQDESLFETATEASATIDSRLAELRALVADNPAQGPLLAQLTTLARQRVHDTEAQRQRALQGDASGIRTEISSGSAKKLMDASRYIVAQMQAEEKRLLELHGNATRSAYETVAFAIWGAAAVAAALLIAITLVTLRDAGRLRRLQEELATTLRSVGDAVIATDANGAVRFLNAVAEQLTGWPSEAARGRPLDQVFRIINEQSRLPVESPVSKVLRENAVVGLANHTVLRARDGTERPIEDSGAPIRGAQGEITGVVLVFRDATTERAARQALIDSRDALREADRRKDVFLATLSHELRNPLAPIRTATRLLETPGVSADDAERSRAIISRQVRHMAALLDDLLDISRITRGVLSLKLEDVELRALMEAALEIAQPVIARKQHALSVRWPPEAVRLRGDPVRLTQVIANLLTNAAKYTRPGGQIEIAVTAKDEEIVIAVRDSGIGIAADMLPRVFEMFSQIDSGQEYADGGVGIGLALVRGFVELHGGLVEARSAGLDMGSEFIVHLPGLRIAASDPPAAPPAAASGTAAAVAPARSVLLADDNRDGAEIMAMLLEQSGYRVRLAFDGIEALNVAVTERPQAAILDIGMPGLDGYEVARRIRAESWGREMHLVAVTGWGQDDDKRRALEAGFDHHLTKPIDPDALERLLSQPAAVDP
jgi:PAS domain S-box-containing protein